MDFAAQQSEIDLFTTFRYFLLLLYILLFVKINDGENFAFKYTMTYHVE